MKIKAVVEAENETLTPEEVKARLIAQIVEQLGPRLEYTRRETTYTAEVAVFSEFDYNALLELLREANQMAGIHPRLRGTLEMIGTLLSSTS